MKRITAYLLLALFLPQTPAAAQDPVKNLPDASRWMDHLTQELLPFWDQPSALGVPVGSFPSVRCNDGSLVDRSNPCPEVNNPYLMQNDQYVVALSRQVYAYEVAFHMTGETRYLGYARAGIQYLLDSAFDHTSGGMFEFKDLDSGLWQPAAPYRDPQQLAYGLVGMAFYYYLTRDPATLDEIDAVRNYIRTSYWNRSLGCLQFLLQDTADTKAVNRQLVATLDQLNTHMAMIGRFVPGDRGVEWRGSACDYAHSIITEFYVPSQNLFFLSANQPADLDLSQSATDFGHNAKAMWMILMAGRACGDSGLVSFAKEHAPGILDRAWPEQQGTWSGNIGPSGIGPTIDWWMHAELDQLSGTLALTDPSFAARLSRSYDYWFKYFVDHTYGEVWTTVDTTTSLSTNAMPKEWPWKNGYHSFEHALVGYITTAALKDNSVPLYFAFEERPAPDQIQPYFFSGDVQSYEDIAGGAEPVQRVTFSNVNIDFTGTPLMPPCADAETPAQQSGDCRPPRTPTIRSSPPVEAPPPHFVAMPRR